MKTMRPRTKRPSANGRTEPTWDIALLWPEQGQWSVDEYLSLPGNRLVEYSDGFLEVLPMPTTLHQWIIAYLLRRLEDFTGAWSGLGLALPAAIRIKLWEDKFREPDIVFMLTKHRRRAHEEFWEGADLVMEVVSDDPTECRRDLVTKRAEYARARIAEYWIVDPKVGHITVLRLKGKVYAVHGIFKSGQMATSALLPGFSIDVRTVFAGP